MNRRTVQITVLAIAVLFTSMALLELASETSLTNHLNASRNKNVTGPTTTEGGKSILYSPLPISVLPNGPLRDVASITYHNLLYISPITWMIFLLTLFYKGRTKSVWYKNGFDYDTFRMLAKMRGSETRVKILQNLSLPKNKLQLANELECKWRAVDHHICMLVDHGLVQEMASVGTSIYFIITKKGSDALSLLNNGHSSI